LDALAEGGEEFHEATDAEVSGAVTHKKKDGRQVSKEKIKRDFSLRKPTISQEVKWKQKASASSVRNDGVLAGWEKRAR
jgi:hypothetical protein